MKHPALAVLLLSCATSWPAWSGGIGNGINDSVNDSLVEAGDALQVLLPATGLLAAWLHDDGEGAKQLALSTLGTQAIVHGTKLVVSRGRPNESDWNSFPSGHTAAAFSGAAFLQSRYGAAWGAPAYAAATLVGASRVHGNRHYAGDVVAGAATAFFVNQYLVSPYRGDGVYIGASPTADGFALGVTLTEELLAPGRRPAARDSAELRHRLELGVGSNWTDSAAKLDREGLIESRGPIDAHQPFAYVNYRYALDRRDYLELLFSPSETRRRGTLRRDLAVDGHRFFAGDQVLTAYRHWIAGGGVNREVALGSSLSATLGVGLYWHRLEAAIDRDAEGGCLSSLRHDRALPALRLGLSHQLTEGVALSSRFEYQGWQGDSYRYLDAGVSYSPNPAWELGIRLARSEGRWRGTELGGGYDSHSLVLTLANRF